MISRRTASLTGFGHRSLVGDPRENLVGLPIGLATAVGGACWSYTFTEYEFGLPLQDSNGGSITPPPPGPDFGLMVWSLLAENGSQPWTGLGADFTGGPLVMAAPFANLQVLGQLAYTGPACTVYLTVSSLAIAGAFGDRGAIFALSGAEVYTYNDFNPPPPPTPFELSFSVPDNPGSLTFQVYLTGAGTTTTIEYHN